MIEAFEIEGEGNHLRVARLAVYDRAWSRRRNGKVEHDLRERVKVRVTYEIVLIIRSQEKSMGPVEGDLYASSRNEFSIKVRGRVTKRRDQVASKASTRCGRLVVSLYRCVIAICMLDVVVVCCC